LGEQTVSNSYDLLHHRPQREYCPRPLGNRHDGDLQTVFGTEADLVARHANDAWVPLPKHLNAHAAAQTKFLKAMDVVRMTLYPANPGALASQHLAQANGAVVHDDCSIGFLRAGIKDECGRSRKAASTNTMGTAGRMPYWVNGSAASPFWSTPHWYLHKAPGFRLVIAREMPIVPQKNCLPLWDLHFKMKAIKIEASRSPLFLTLASPNRELGGFLPISNLTQFST
jgi:hypothetical protein